MQLGTKGGRAPCGAPGCSPFLLAFRASGRAKGPFAGANSTRIRGPHGKTVANRDKGREHLVPGSGSRSLRYEQRRALAPRALPPVGTPRRRSTSARLTCYLLDSFAGTRARRKPRESYRPPGVPPYRPADRRDHDQAEPLLVPPGQLQFCSRIRQPDGRTRRAIQAQDGIPAADFEYLRPADTRQAAHQRKTGGKSKRW